MHSNFKPIVIIIVTCERNAWNRRMRMQTLKFRYLQVLCVVCWKCQQLVLHQRGFFHWLGGPLKKDVRNCRDLQLMDCCFSMDWNDLSNSKRLCLFCGLQNYEKDKWNIIFVVQCEIAFHNIWTTVLGMGRGARDKTVGMGWGWGEFVGLGWGWGKNLWGQGGDGDRNNGDGWGWGPILVPMQLSNLQASLH